MNVMKIIMELKTKIAGGYGLRKSEAARLDQKGVANIEILRKCWKHELSKSDFVAVHDLCLILQSYGLIYPIDPVSICEGTVLQGIEYIIPCKFPDCLPKCQDCVPKASMSFTFYVTFNFLPEEIYCKLICLASAESKPNRGHNRYSKTSCFFSGLLDTNWVIEIEQEKEQLMIMVL